MPRRHTGLFFSRLSKSYTGATAVLVDEFDAPSSEGVLSLQFAHLQGDFAKMQGRRVEFLAQAVAAQ
jgi:hypothetical protein